MHDASGGGSAVQCQRQHHSGKASVHVKCPCLADHTTEWNNKLSSTFKYISAAGEQTTGAASATAAGAADGQDGSCSFWRSSKKGNKNVGALAPMKPLSTMAKVIKNK